MQFTRKKIARASFTSNTSTEIQYLIRYARRVGLTANIIHKDRIQDMPYPSLIGTTLGINTGHFVALLNVQEGKVTVGYPLIGQLEMFIEEFNEHYYSHKFGIHFSKYQDF